MDKINKINEPDKKDKILDIENLKKTFGNKIILNNLSMNIKENRIYSLMGTNGSGKTTLFNIISGFIECEEGKIIFDGKLISKRSPVEINYLGINRTFQDLRLIRRINVKENILLALKNNPCEKIFNSMLPKFIFKKQYENFSKEADIILKKIFLNKVATNLAGEISFGQQKLLTIGCCIANDARLLLLDEPVAGINLAYQSIMIKLLSELKKNGKTILLIEHNTDFIESISDYILFLFEGEIIEFSNFTELRESKIVKEAYL